MRLSNIQKQNKTNQHNLKNKTKQFLPFLFSFIFYLKSNINKNASFTKT